MTGSAPVILAERLTRVYRLPGSEIAGIAGVDLAVLPGRFVVLKGNSGSGKSTLLALVAGLDRPTSGALTVGGTRLHDATAKQLVAFRRKTVGMVFQSFNLLPTLTVLENACVPALLAGESPASARPRAERWLARLGMEGRLSHVPSQLSGGEMQRTAIARALINDPAVILADEPTGNLDSANGEAVIRLLAQLRDEFGRTVVMATHSSLADHVADEAVRLRDGRRAEAP